MSGASSSAGSNTAAAHHSIPWCGSAPHDRPAGCRLGRLNSWRSYTPKFARSWIERGLPTEAPLKNAPFSRYLRSKMLSTNSSNRSAVDPSGTVNPALALVIKFDET